MQKHQRSREQLLKTVLKFLKQATIRTWKDFKFGGKFVLFCFVAATRSFVSLIAVE